MQPPTANSKTSPALRFLPSLADVAFLMPLVFLFSRMQGVRALLSDCDTGWHVRAGEWMLAHHAVIRTDVFSFTKPGEPWYAWEWLWEVIFAWLHRRGGLELVVLTSLAVICGSFALLYRVSLRRCGSPPVAAGIALLAAAGSTMHWLARPHLFTFLFAVIFLAILDRVREGRKRLLWWLPALTVLWVNLHGGFIAGIIILAAYAGGELLRAALAANAEERSSALGWAGPYTLTALGCAAASLINPYGYKLHVHLWQYFHDPDQTRFINEFQPVNFQLPVAGFLEGMLILAAGAGVWFALRRRFAEVLLLAGWAHLSLLMARNVAVFMIVAAPAVAEALTAWIKSVEQAPIARWARAAATLANSAGEEMAPMENVPRLHLLPAAVFAALAFGMASPHAGLMLRPVFDEKTYPAQALAVISKPSMRVFTHDEWGDYLIYKLSPAGVKVFVDGRSDFYGGKFTHTYMDLLSVKDGWQQTLAHYGVNTILLPPDTPLAGALRESVHWRVMYQDGVAVVFGAVASAPALPISAEGQGGKGHGETAGSTGNRSGSDRSVWRGDTVPLQSLWPGHTAPYQFKGERS